MAAVYATKLPMPGHDGGGGGGGGRESIGREGGVVLRREEAGWWSWGATFVRTFAGFVTGGVQGALRFVSGEGHGVKRTIGDVEREDSSIDERLSGQTSPTDTSSSDVEIISHRRIRDSESPSKRRRIMELEIEEEEEEEESENEKARRMILERVNRYGTTGAYERRAKFQVPGDEDKPLSTLEKALKMRSAQRNKPFRRIPPRPSLRELPDSFKAKGFTSAADVLKLMKEKYDLERKPVQSNYDKRRQVELNKLLEDAEMDVIKGGNVDRLREYHKNIDIITEKLQKGELEDEDEPVPPLTEAEKKRLNVFRQSPNSFRGLKNPYTNAEISPQTLLQRNFGSGATVWYNDDMIDYYLGLVCHRANAGRTTKKVHAFTTFFYTSMATGGYEKVKRWAKKRNVDIGGAKLLKLDYLFVPINLSQSHWVLGVVNFKKKQFEYFDSLGGKNATVLKVLRKYVYEESEHKVNLDEWKDVCWGSDGPQQGNMSDCGVFTVKTAEVLSRDKKPVFTAQEARDVRMRILCEILDTAQSRPV
ncbi:cysteine proteinase [Ascobolus immersus RN42]|uniref:Cysteine proteinase n=1 Tax=Ascobolus immersus RN42 TaxID=1160509 RepID=A0A3N4IR88_ASCIM|nr:cysteine proteinase [Ascobolus immersus RN42]